MTWPPRWTGPQWKSSMVTKADEKAAKKSKNNEVEKAAKFAVWARAKSRCETCGTPVSKGLDSLTAGHIHHVTKRSQGGTWDVENLRLLCRKCHDVAHGRT